MSKLQKERRSRTASDMGDVAAYSAADAAARPFEAAAEQAGAEMLANARALTEITRSTPKLEQLVESYGEGNAAQFGGRLLEFLSEASFNADAAQQGESVRVYMTHFASPFAPADPASPADLQVFSATGEILGEFQSKSVSDTARRVHELAQAKYSGMKLLVPSDHVEPTEALVDRRIQQANPDFLNRADYESLRERLTGSIRHGSVRSEGFDENAIAAAARDPRGALDSLDKKYEDARASAEQRATEATFESIAASALSAGLAAASVTALLQGARSMATVRAGEMSPTAAALATASDCAAAFARAALVGAGGQGLSALTDAGFVPEGLGAGTLPFALARSGVAVAETSLAYARGQLSGPEAAARMGESLSRTSIVWAASIVGQAAIPVPVVGALIGGTVGSVCSTVAIKGIQSTVALAQDARTEREILAQLEVEVAAALVVLDEERRIIDQLARAHESAFNITILPALDRLEATLAGGSTESALTQVNRLIVLFGQAPLFGTFNEFDHWMADRGSALVIRPNGRR